MDFCDTKRKIDFSFNKRVNIFDYSCKVFFYYFKFEQNKNCISFS